MLSSSITGACEEREFNGDCHRDIKRAGLCDVLHFQSENLRTAQERYKVCESDYCVVFMCTLVA